MSQFDGGHPTVLGAEDSDDFRQVLGMELRHMGCRVLMAADGREAVGAPSDPNRPLGYGPA